MGKAYHACERAAGREAGKLEGTSDAKKGIGGKILSGAFLISDLQENRIPALQSCYAGPRSPEGIA